MSELPKAPIVRICKSCGDSVRISEEGGIALTEAVEKYAQEFSEAVIDIANHAGRKTVQPEDVKLALKYF